MFLSKGLRPGLPLRYVSNYDDNGNKSNSFARFARFVRAFFTYRHFADRSSSFHAVKWPVLQLCGRREYMMKNVQFCLISEALVPIQFRDGKNTFCKPNDFE